MDYYKILGVDKDATDKDIKKAYKKLAILYHPDKPTGNEEKFKELSEAYNALCDPEKRKLYDRFGKEGLKQDGYSNVNAEEIFKNFFGNDNMFDGGIFNDNDMFGNVFTSNSRFYSNNRFPNMMKSKDDPIYFDVLCSLEDLDKGTIKKIKVTKKIVNKFGKHKKVEKIFNVNIKPGWKEGTKITYVNEGDVYEGSNRTPADLIFIVKQKPNDKFIRDNNNIIIKVNITLSEALTGFIKEVVTLRGEKIKIGSNKVVKPDQTIIVNNKGMTIKNQNNDIKKRGSLVVKYIIDFPNTIDDNKKKILKDCLC